MENPGIGVLGIFLGLDEEGGRGGGPEVYRVLWKLSRAGAERKSIPIHTFSSTFVEGMRYTQ